MGYSGTGNGKPSTNRPRGPNRAAKWVVDPEDGRLRIVQARDTVAALYAKGALSDDMAEAMAMKRAGETFAACFWMARLVGYRTSSLEPRSRGNGDAVTEEIVRAKRWVDGALAAVGGVGSLGGSVLWHVVGLGETLNEWANTAALPSGAPRMRQTTATLVLVAALQALASRGKQGVDNVGPTLY